MRILFAGTPEFAARHLDGLVEAGVEAGVELVGVLTQPDKPGKRGRKPVASAVKQRALAHGLSISQPRKLTPSDVGDVDLLIVVAYGQILKPEVLALPTHGCVNVHGSLLPRWRGAAPVQRAIEAGDTETGICIMQMDAGLDTGAILWKQPVPIAPNDTAATVSERLAPVGIAGLLKVINSIERGQLNPEPQPEGATYARKLTKEEAQLDWRASSSELARKIRAFNPDPIAYGYLGTLRTRFYLASSSDDPAAKAPPGEVIEVSKAGVRIACGKGTLLIEKLQLPIGKGSILTGADVKNARTDLIHPGARFQ